MKPTTGVYHAAGCNFRARCNAMTPEGGARCARHWALEAYLSMLNLNWTRLHRDAGRRGLDLAAAERIADMHVRARFAAKTIRDREGRPWRVRAYQAGSLESWADRKVHCDGRDVGKTSEIEIIACWAAVMCPNREMLIATQCENHLFPLMHRLARQFSTNGRLSPGLAEMRQTPAWYLRFNNGFTLWGRIAGPRGVNFQGLHVDWQIVDEAQELTETAWGELYQALNAGGRRWVYGVPNGRRNTFYRMTRIVSLEQHHWPSTLNPDFTAEKDAELAALYGGRDSPGYIHRVLGQHGAPAHAVFSLDDYLECVDASLAHENVTLRETDDYAPPPEIVPGAYYLGCDLGYARDPSEFTIYRNAPPHLVNTGRIRLEGVNYARQQALIEALDRAYGFRAIGIDCGNSGRAVAHNLMAQGPAWCAKVRAFEFGGIIDLEPLPDGRPTRRRTKEFMTELIQRRLAERTLVFPPIADREEQYAAHTYTVGAAGQVVYEKGNDHLIDADRCAVLAHYLDTAEGWHAGGPAAPAVMDFF